MSDGQGKWETVGKSKTNGTLEGPCLTVYPNGVGRLNSEAADQLNAAYVKILVDADSDEIALEEADGDTEVAYSVADKSNSVSVAGMLNKLQTERPDSTMHIELEQVADDPIRLQGEVAV